MTAFLLATTTLLYAGYNLFIKVSGNHVPSTATTTLMATICLQLAALATSLAFAGWLIGQGGHSFQLTHRAYLWAAVAGICIGAAEISYLYLFGGVGGVERMQASTAIPIIVSGTILIAGLFAALVLRENIGLYQITGGLLMIGGVGMFFFGK